MHTAIRTPNRAPEKALIEQFVSHVSLHPDPDLRLERMINADCRSRVLADVEYISRGGLHWVIEAKSNDSRDKYNTVHKIFGELLKETGRANRAGCRHAILLPSNALHFYSTAFRCIAREKFMGFGALIPIDTVFLSGRTGVSRITWNQLYEGNAAQSVGGLDECSTTTL